MEAIKLLAIGCASGVLDRGVSFKAGVTGVVCRFVECRGTCRMDETPIPEAAKRMPRNFRWIIQNRDWRFEAENAIALSIAKDVFSKNFSGQFVSRTTR